MLTTTNLTIMRGDKLLIQGAELFMARNEKIGIVGVNGAGKSTFLKCIAGIEEVDMGKINFSGSIAYLAQEIHKEIERINLKLSEEQGRESRSNLTIEEYLVLENSIDIQSWEIGKFLNLLNMPEKTPESLIGELSGGQKVKVEIIKLLFKNPDLLILDEPTNFLDIPSAEWLMRYLSNYRGAVLIVSHDLRLMNRSLDKVWFLNERSKKIEVYKGNYDQFIKAKELSDSQLVQQIKSEQEKYQKMIKHAATLSSRGSTKEKMKAAKIRAKAQNLREEIGETQHLLAKSKKMRVSFKTFVHPGRLILEVKNIRKSYDRTILNDVSFKLERGEKMVVIGKNGAGKSTLLKVLMEKVKQESGEVNWGYNVDKGYYAQEYEGLDYSKSIIENMKSTPRIREMEDEYVRKVLGSFLFSNDKIYQKVESLSGGEKTRLALAKIMACGYNTLLLDEPTTYLDPASQGILLEALSEYKGTLILVSHEPLFVKSLKVDRVLLMPEESLTHYHESYIDRVGIT